MERRSSNRYDGIDPFTANLSKRVARQLVGQYDFRESDLEDLEQELVMAGLRAAPHHDPARGPREALINRAIRNQARKLIAASKAACRDYRQVKCSLNDRVEVGEEGKTFERAELFDAQDYLQLTRGVRSSDPDLLVDLARSVEELPLDQQTICRAIDAGSNRGLWTTLGIGRSTLYERRNRLCQTLADAGLRIYLD